MKKAALSALTLATAAAWPMAAHAEDKPAPDLTITGSASVVSQYRLRGISQSNGRFAVQGGITASHKSGAYFGTWASNLAGYGTFGGANAELDLFGGYTHTFGDTTVDGGLIWYIYPGTSGRQFGEIYASVTQPVGPVKAKVGTNYAFKQSHLGDVDNIWVYGELAAPIQNTPITLKGHLGYTEGKGSLFSGPDGHYLDYSVGADIAWKALTLNVSYVGTNINRTDADAYFTVPGGKLGRDIIKGAAVISLTAAI